MTTSLPSRYRFQAEDRLHGRNDFSQVFQARMKKSAGPLLAWSRPNQINRHRLGLSVPRAAGHAVRRHRIKRLLREAFRLHRHQWPGAYDVVIHVRLHPSASLEQYRVWLSELWTALHADWTRRQKRNPLADRAEGDR